MRTYVYFHTQYLASPFVSLFPLYLSSLFEKLEVELHFFGSYTTTSYLLKIH